MTSEKKHSFNAWGYSDDCAGIDGADCESEYDCEGEWFEFKVDGIAVGRCRIAYNNRNWEFEVKDSTVKIEAGKKL